MDIAPLVTLAGTAITTVGTIVVAVITTRNRQETKTAQDNADQARAELDHKMDHIKLGLQEIQTELKSNTACSVATARGLISQVYTANKDRQEITEKTWRNVCDLYQAYKSVKLDGHTPNSWCDAIVEEMKTWKKI